MRKVILIMLLTAVSSSAMAEWVAVGSNKYTTIYVDATTIKKVGNMATMWHLTDYTIANQDMGEAYKSTKDQFEYDCKEAKTRRRAASQHSDNMGKGKVVYSDTYTSRWKSIPPDSGEEILLKFACAKH